MQTHPEKTHREKYRLFSSGLRNTLCFRDFRARLLPSSIPVATSLSAMNSGPNDRASSQPPTPISARERQVLARVAIGRTSKEIAGELGITLRTVHAHRENLARKLGTSSVAAQTRYALEHGIDVESD
jgi:DNA-binding CsgD family transcriptional regulator